MMREPILRGVKGERKAKSGGQEERTILSGFVQFLRSGIDRFGDFRVVVRVADSKNTGRGRQPVRLDLPVAGVQCDHETEKVCLLAPGLLPEKGAERRRKEADEDEEGSSEGGLVLRDLLNQLSTAAAQGPDHALALCDVQDATGGDGARRPRRRQLTVEGLQVKPRPAHKTLRFVVTVSG